MIQFGSCVLLLLAGCALTGASTVQQNVDASYICWYGRNSSKACVNLSNVTQLIPYLNTSETTVLYIHGHTESLDTATVQQIIDAHLKYTPYNILGLDYRNISQLDYILSVAEVKVLAIKVAKSIEALAAGGVEYDKFRIIGHSLGAQLAGHIGRRLPFKLPRITGLDPAGPLFIKINQPLSASDAKFVDIIHTDAFVLGQPEPTGTVDFYPNCGHGPQPGCIAPGISNTSLCSHHRSWKFWLESLENPNAFVGVKCNGWVSYVVGKCDNNEYAVLGEYASPEKKGIYFLHTNASEPFGLGKAGAPFKASH